MKIIVVLSFFILHIPYLNAQSDQQTTVVLERRIYTISKDSSENWIIPKSLNIRFLQMGEIKASCDSVLNYLLIHSFFIKKD